MIATLQKAYRFLTWLGWVKGVGQRSKKEKVEAADLIVCCFYFGNRVLTMN
jgi:hypothetical protein